MHHKQHTFHSYTKLYLLIKSKLSYIPQQFSYACWPCSLFNLWFAADSELPTSERTHANTLKPWVQVWNNILSRTAPGMSEGLFILCVYMWDYYGMERRNFLLFDMAVMPHSSCCKCTWGQFFLLFVLFCCACFKILEDSLGKLCSKNVLHAWRLFKRLEKIWGQKKDFVFGPRYKHLNSISLLPCGFYPAIISTGCNLTVLSEVTDAMWCHGDIATLRSDVAENMSCQPIISLSTYQLVCKK